MGLWQRFGEWVDRYREARYWDWMPDGDGFARGGDILGPGVQCREYHVRETLDVIRVRRRKVIRGEYVVTGCHVTGYFVSPNTVVFRDGKRTPLYNFGVYGMVVEDAESAIDMAAWPAPCAPNDTHLKG